MLAFVHLISQVFGDTRPLRESLHLAASEARRAIELDPDESSAIAVLADIACSQARYESALEQAERAISVNPNNIIAYFAKGRALTFSGRPDEAKATLLIARSLSPRDALAAPVLEMLVYGCYFSMDYAGAANWRNVRSRNTPITRPCTACLPQHWDSSAVSTRPAKR